MDGDKMSSYLAVYLVGFIVCFISNQVTGAFMPTLQSTYQDDANSGHAIDADVNTCAKTGYDKGPWWMVDLGASQKVTKVEILGNLEQFEIRVGDIFNPLGNHAGFEDNKKCTYYNDQLNTTMARQVHCRKERTGRYVTIQIVNTKPRSMTLCDVKVM